MARSAKLFYHGLLSEAEKDSLGEAAAAQDLGSEIELMRVLVLRAVAGGETVEAISKVVSRLGQLLRVQHVLSGDAARSLDTALAQVLAEIGSEIGL